MIADVAVMDAFESGVLDLPDFYLTGDDYRCRFEPVAKNRFLNVLRERFNAGVRYKGDVFKWDTLIEQKTKEPGRFLLGRGQTVDFSGAPPLLYDIDSSNLRKQVLALSQCQARKLGIVRSTMHNLKRNASNALLFRMYRSTRSKLS